MSDQYEESDASAFLGDGGAAAFFTAVVLGTRVKLHILATRLPTAAKRLFGVPDFRYYGLADGIAEVCGRSPRRSPPGTDPDTPSSAWLCRRIFGEGPGNMSWLLLGFLGDCSAKVRREADYRHREKDRAPLPDCHRSLVTVALREPGRRERHSCLTTAR